MDFKIKFSVLLTIFLMDIFASVGSSKFFHIKTNNMNIIVPIPNDPSLDTSLPEPFKEEFYQQSEYDKAELPPELKETVHLENEITIIYPSADFENFNYLKFYLWLNKISFDKKIDCYLSKHILYYLNYFRCNSKEPLFYLFEHVIYLLRNKYAASFFFFKEIKKYQLLMSLFLNDSEENVEVLFKKSYHLWQLERVLVPDIYSLRISEIDSYLFCGLFLKNKEILTSLIKYFRKNINNETKLLISIDTTILNKAIEKSKTESNTSNETFDSLRICAKIFEALEYFATENKLAKSECVKGELLIANLDYKNIPILNSVDHLLLVAMGLEYTVSTLKIDIYGNLIDLNDILNSFDSGLCHEFWIGSNVCRIKSLGEIKRVVTYVDKVEMEEYPDSNKIKLILRDSIIKNKKPIFSNVVLVGEINNQDARKKYSSFGLEEFLGPISENLT